MRSPLVSAAIVVFAVCLGLVACSLSGEYDGDVYRPQVLLDSYLVAHGMAASIASDADASPEVVMELSRLDRLAADAVRALVRRPDANLAETDNAIAALAEYAARQSADATPRSIRN